MCMYKHIYGRKTARQYPMRLVRLFNNRGFYAIRIICKNLGSNKQKKFAAFLLVCHRCSRNWLAADFKKQVEEEEEN